MSKFRGLEISGFWLDEAQDLSPDVKMILSGRLRYPLEHPHYIGILTTNPCSVDHWLYKSFVADPLESHEYWRQTANENKHLPESYYDDMAAAFRDRPEMYRRYVLGEWGAVFSGKAVYSEEFHFDTHVAKKPIQPVADRPIIRGWDFGLSPACGKARGVKRPPVGFFCDGCELSPCPAEAIFVRFRVYATRLFSMLNSNKSKNRIRVARLTESPRRDGQGRMRG